MYKTIEEIKKDWDEQEFELLKIPKSMMKYFMIDLCSAEMLDVTCYGGRCTECKEKNIGQRARKDAEQFLKEAI